MIVYIMLKWIPYHSKKLNFTNPSYSKLVLSSNKYVKEFSKLNYIKFEDGLKRMIDWNKKWQKLN